MKRSYVFLTLLLIMFSCKNENAILTKNEFKSFGDKIVPEEAISTLEMAEIYFNLKIGDTVQAKVEASIKEVCSKKGCWMKLDLGNDQEIMVRFKDYGFFMPLNAEGNVIVQGKAFITETTVDELRHYAEDSGKSEKEILAVTEHEKTFAFEADGVLLKQ